MRTANPALNAKAFQSFGTVAAPAAMTIGGTVNKTGILVLILVGAASWPWTTFFSTGNPASVTAIMFGGIIGSLLVAIITVVRKTLAPLTAPLYAVLEGLALGSISAFFEARFPGIVIQAVGLTFATLFALLMAYRSGLIRATENFKLGVVAATGGIFLVYMASMVMGFFGIAIPLFTIAAPSASCSAWAWW